MIKLNFCISNPFKEIGFSNSKWWAGKTFIPDKNWELQLLRCKNIIKASVEIMSPRSFHQRVIEVEFGLLTFNFIFLIYDTRHHK